MRVTQKKTAKPNKRARTAEIIRILDETYPNVVCALHHNNAWELLIATILSAQCTDKRVNEVTPGLFAKYPTIQDFAAARQEVLAADIRSTGFFNNKAKSIIGAAKKILKAYGGEVTKTLEELITIPGAARKTANVVLGTAFGITSGIVVDTHVQRISQRLGWTKAKDPDKIEIDLCKKLPRADWDLTAHLLIFHGRQICFAAKPLCGECKVNALCPSAFRAEKIGRKPVRKRPG